MCIFVLRRNKVHDTSSRLKGRSTTNRNWNSRRATPDATLLRWLAPAWTHKSAWALMTRRSCGTEVAVCLKHRAFRSFQISHPMSANRESKPLHLSACADPCRRRHQWRTWRYGWAHETLGEVHNDPNQVHRQQRRYGMNQTKAATTPIWPRPAATTSVQYEPNEGSLWNVEIFLISIFSIKWTEYCIILTTSVQYMNNQTKAQSAHVRSIGAQRQKCHDLIKIWAQNGVPQFHTAILLSSSNDF
jgi:hypothetical protein